ncbi:MAG: hypothetical protein EBS01_02545 [Verrucomicrobia bacterium]|nr:hypothetical protein [Verrucomicrobiota bacterium]
MSWGAIKRRGDFSAAGPQAVGKEAAIINFYQSFSGPNSVARAGGSEPGWAADFSVPCCCFFGV